MEITYRPIGFMRTPFTQLEAMPIQPTGGGGKPGVAEIREEFLAGLKDLEGFSHLILIYHLHRVKRVDLTVTPFLDEAPHGVFATRAPTRPNPIGVSVVELERLEENRLYLKSVDILDGTPILDIKPFVPDFDQPPGASIGWLEKARDRIRSTESDSRFTADKEPSTGEQRHDI
jgi:tRNA-Thr(GGU) m(6)t(6)A37 methyltransferase TsaA